MNTNSLGTDKHTFMDIFQATFDNDGESVVLQKIVIPIIQRDYAQGRDEKEKDGPVFRVRNRFLDALKNAITSTPITLDFVYGDIDAEGTLTPLDGQQRLTTLFLLHWYVAKKEHIPEAEYEFLNNFSYEIRYSARDFCHDLFSFNPEFPTSENGSLRAQITDQPWFPLDWEKDPTIKSMLVMLDAIDGKFYEVEDIWEGLKKGAISFYFLPIRDMGLTDELYIKMNSRGKPLTRFEHFKAEFEHEMKRIDTDLSERIVRKIDGVWTDLLWKYRGDNNITDDEFLRYFRFICDVICYQSGETVQGKSSDEFDLLKEYFSKECETAKENICTMEKFFDCWCSLNESPQEFLERFISHNHEIGKIKIENRDDIDIFSSCLRTYADVLGNGNRSFPLGRHVLLFAIVTYLCNREEVSEDDFSLRLRVVNNLIRNSSDEISDSIYRVGGNRMPAILEQVTSIILKGEFLSQSDIGVNFNANQVDEEIAKTEWLKTHTSEEERETLFRLEDHALLNGQIGIVGLDHLDYAEKFEELFKCNRGLVSQALLTVGDYSQAISRRKYQLGSKIDSSWISLFHKTGRADFENTSSIVLEFLQAHEELTDDVLKTEIDNYIAECEEQKLFDWRYYFMKYRAFHPDRYGIYLWEDRSKPYEMMVIWAPSQVSVNAYQPFLMESDKDHISKDDFGMQLNYAEKRVLCTNNAYVVQLIDKHAEIQRVTIAQNEDGIDTEDRILEGKKLVAELRASY